MHHHLRPSQATPTTNPHPTTRMRHPTDENRPSGLPPRKWTPQFKHVYKLQIDASPLLTLLAKETAWSRQRRSPVPREVAPTVSRLHRIHQRRPTPCAPSLRPRNSTRLFATQRKTLKAT